VRDAEHVQRVEVVWGNGERAFVAGDRLGDAARLLVSERASEDPGE
jgi:hypothetical protein